MFVSSGGELFSTKGITRGRPYMDALTVIPLTNKLQELHGLATQVKCGLLISVMQLEKVPEALR